MEGPANTLGYFVAGYAIILIALAAYLASLALRFRNLRQDAEALEQLAKEDKQSEVHGSESRRLAG